MPEATGSDPGKAVSNKALTRKSGDLPPQSLVQDRVQSFGTRIYSVMAANIRAIRPALCVSRVFARRVAQQP
jgi:hypothetical protein